MTYGAFVEFAGTMECFELSLLAQRFDDSRVSMRVQLSRWMKDGKVIGLRRGVYALPEVYRRVALIPARLANQLYRPSYLSGLWALGHYDLIPERVVWLTSVTPRGPRRFENPCGIFDYRNIKQEAFFGYMTVSYGGREILVAEPEKALLDHWRLTPGEWTPDRLLEMRYQHPERVNAAKLHAYAARLCSPRLVRTVARWLTLAAQEEKGTVTL
jgi:predicted transcriptional regulator of viral defense system